MAVTIKALIFDLDGVIVKTAEYHYLSWKRLADEEGLPFDRVANERLRGVERRESLNRLLDGRPLSEIEKQDWMTRKNRYYLDLIKQMSAADREPGLNALLEEAKRNNIKLAVASASRNVWFVLEKLDLLAHFEVVGGPQTVPNPKPAPDLFIWTAGYLRVDMRETVVLEDSAESIRAANQAGFWTVGIGPNFPMADRTYPTLEAVSIADLAETLSLNPDMVK